MGNEVKEKKLELKVCGDNEVCLSYYVRTDITFNDGYDVITTLAGSWEKSCTGRSDKHITDLFGEDISDGCKEVKKDIKVCTTNA